MRPEGPDGLYDERAAIVYNEYLRDRGYPGKNPWHDYANSGIDPDGNVLSGWFLNNADQPANIREEDSETPYLTRRGIEFIDSQGEKPWCCHLSYIKPHWPYIAPAPYHDMYGPEHFLDPVRSIAEAENAHPVFKGFMNSPVGKAFSRDEVREKVMRAYMGLVKQCDDQLGVLFDWLEKTGRMQDTMIVLTSDHGDFLGDHWLGEKTFFFDASTKVPLIIYDPSSEADCTRGTICDELVESIDLVPTFIDIAGGDPASTEHMLEGRSLAPMLHGTKKEPHRDFVICEYDYSMNPLAAQLELGPDEGRMCMIANKEWKMIHFEGGFRPMLFDLANDPDELNDLGASGSHEEIISAMYEQLNGWARRPSQRTTISYQEVLQLRKGMLAPRGVFVGVVDEADVTADLKSEYVGKKAIDKRVTPTTAGR